MNRSFYGLVFLTLVILALFSWNNTIGIAHGLQTIPTRTPTPGAPPPTVAPPPTSESGGGDNPPPATPAETSVPSNLQTATPTLVPVDQLCSESPAVQTNGLTNVRSGPGTNYEIIAELPYLEKRAIVGRAADVAWWLIQLDDARQGWIADIAVVVSGYIGYLPIVEAPLIGSSTATPGTPWNPTPYPYFCPETPTATNTPTVVPTETKSPVPEATVTTGGSAEPESDATGPTKASQVASAAEAATATLVSEPISTIPAPSPTVASQVEEPAPTSTSQGDLPATAAPLAHDQPAGSNNYLLVVAGILLVVGVVVSLLGRRR